MTEALALIASFGALLLALAILVVMLSARNEIRRTARYVGLSSPSDPNAPSPEPAPADPSSERGAASAAIPNQSQPAERETPPPAEVRLIESLVDPATGLASSRAWNMVLEQEGHRFVRYGHPATILVMELDGLESLAAALGQNAADRLILPVAATLRLNARAADTLARTGYSRFLALLPETDEIQAIGYVDRVRTACDTWLEAGEVSIRLAIGWAQAVSGAQLADAVSVAEKRMNADRRHGRRLPADSVLAETEATGDGERNPSLVG